MTDNRCATTLDPEFASQQVIDAGLVMRRTHPLNAETPITALNRADITPVAQFYARNHFPIPSLDSVSWRLTVKGCVRRSLAYSLEDLRRMPARTQVVTLECAGNNRVALNPKVPGEQWCLGAVSTAEWTGVPLIEILDRAKPTPRAREVVFRGADCGHVDGRPGTVLFERSLRREEIANSGALLAYEMNGVPLPRRHGYPLRLIVPGWYGVASVKWLTEVEVVDHAFDGFFQTARYHYAWQRDGRAVTEPVRRQRVRALITQPDSGQTLTRGALTIRGLAWSGDAPIARVEVSVGEGPWQNACLLGRPEPNIWRRWRLVARVDQPGTITVRARATDLTGCIQPDQPEWNQLGYGANSIHNVSIRLA
jgi:DMSO/TMAO reductase YedYZ molybdopterin-dependent catalytic subunit